MCVQVCVNCTELKPNDTLPLNHFLINHWNRQQPTVKTFGLIIFLGYWIALNWNQTLVKCTTPTGARTAVSSPLGFSFPSLHSVYLMVYDSNEVTSYIGLSLTTYTYADYLRMLLCCLYMVVLDTTISKCTVTYPCKYSDVHMFPWCINQSKSELSAV